MHCAIAIFFSLNSRKLFLCSHSNIWDLSKKVISPNIVFVFKFIFSDSKAPNLGRSTCTTISGCYSPANPLKLTQGSIMSSNRSPRCQETPNIPPACDPSLTLWPSSMQTQTHLSFLERREGTGQTAGMMTRDLMRHATCTLCSSMCNTVRVIVKALLLGNYCPFKIETN